MERPKLINTYNVDRTEICEYGTSFRSRRFLVSTTEYGLYSTTVLYEGLWLDLSSCISTDRRRLIANGEAEELGNQLYVDASSLIHLCVRLKDYDYALGMFNLVTYIESKMGRRLAL